ncbi:MAG TPA: hypothetical protein VFQ65_13835, partial [Kofleriaceae bacterium]|nr:hypothetical protein [Kofleriaceae bacterium]
TIATSLVIAAATGAGAYVGFKRVGECRSANPEPVVTPVMTPVAVPLAPPPVAPVATPAPAPPPATPKPAPPPVKPGAGSGDLPIPPSGLPVPGGT